MNKAQREKKLKQVKEFITKKTKENELLMQGDWDSKEEFHNELSDERIAKRKKVKANKKNRLAKWKKRKKKRDSQNLPAINMGQLKMLGKTKEKKNGNNNKKR